MHMKHVFLSAIICAIIQCVHSASFACNIAIESLHVGLVIWNFVTDVRVYVDMVDTKNDYNSKVSYLSSDSNDYNYTFCYPQYHQPEWYDIIANETLLSCNCDEFLFECESNDTSALSADISCEPQIYAQTKLSQQVLIVKEWTCQICQCYYNMSLISLHSSMSLPVQRLYYEYDIMTNLNIEHIFCDPYSISKHKLSQNNLDTLIKCSIAFLVIGSVGFLINIIIRCCVINADDIKRHLEIIQVKPVKVTQHDKNDVEKTIQLQKLLSEPNDEKKVKTQKKKVTDKVGDVAISKQKQLLKKLKSNAKEQYNAILTIFGTRLIAGFLVNIFHDIPHQIILLFFLKFLYSDYGYVCYDDFVNYPKLRECTFNADEDILVIFARNPILLWSVTASIILVVFNGGYQIYGYLQEVAAAERAHANTLENEWFDSDICGDNKCGACCRYFWYYLVLFIVWIMYIFGHWCFPAYVAYYYISPALYKDWTIALVVFWCGVPVWGILVLLLCCLCCVGVYQCLCE